MRPLTKRRIVERKIIERLIGGYTQSRILMSSFLTLPIGKVATAYSMPYDFG